MQIRYEKEPTGGFDSKEAIVKLVDGTSIKGWVNLKNNTRLSDLLNNYDDAPVKNSFASTEVRDQKSDISKNKEL